tara:strand:+ start:1657 stop:2481 length:825 start_codon:yes stop_codon:yes gene_type:complete
MPKIFNFDTLKENIPKRNVNSHKGNFGKVLVVGGSKGMGGAAILASETCLYCGSGLVHLYANSNAVEASLKRNPEIMAMCMSEKKLFPKQLNVILCGPGLSSDSLSKKMFLNACDYKNLDGLILDAGALKLLFELDINNIDNLILTPHPGEAAMLLNTSVSEIQNNRIDSIKMISKNYNANVILKGNDTLFFDKKHNEIYQCSEGGPELATGGTGDILAGVITSLVGQKLEITNACNLAIAAHARAGVIFKKSIGEIGLNASSLIPIIRKILNK